MLYAVWCNDVCLAGLQRKRSPIYYALIFNHPKNPQLIMKIQTQLKSNCFALFWSEQSVAHTTLPATIRRRLKAFYERYNEGIEFLKHSRKGKQYLSMPPLNKAIFQIDITFWYFPQLLNHKQNDACPFLPPHTNCMGSEIKKNLSSSCSWHYIYQPMEKTLRFIYLILLGSTTDASRILPLHPKGHRDI